VILFGETSKNGSGREDDLRPMTRDVLRRLLAP
jgi:hypothetical protein